MGETTFLIQPLPRDESGKPSAAGEKGAQATYRIQATRKFDEKGSSQRGSGTTSVLGDGTPLKFQETVNGSSVDNRHFRQETSLDFSDGNVRVRFTQGTKEQAPSEVEIPKGTFLYANQAVEHWAIFLSKLPANLEKHMVKLFYPDFHKVMDVSFERAAVEKIQMTRSSVETTRYHFVSKENHLEGTVWLDPSRRLIQIEFPNDSKELSLRVTLAE